MKFKVGQKVKGTKALYDMLGSDSRFCGYQLTEGAVGTIRFVNEKDEWCYTVMFVANSSSGEQRHKTNNYMEDHLYPAISEQLDLV